METQNRLIGDMLGLKDSLKERNEELVVLTEENTKLNETVADLIVRVRDADEKIVTMGKEAGHMLKVLVDCQRDLTKSSLLLSNANGVIEDLNRNVETKRLFIEKNAETILDLNNQMYELKSENHLKGSEIAHLKARIEEMKLQHESDTQHIAMQLEELVYRREAANAQANERSAQSRSGKRAKENKESPPSKKGDNGKKKKPNRTKSAKGVTGHPGAISPGSSPVTGLFNLDGLQLPNGGKDTYVYNLIYVS